MDEKQLKAMLKETFDTVSGGYDSEALRFFQASAEHMPVLLGLQGNENVLDVACGTGNVALAIAKFLPTGQVTALDFSSGMLDQARRKAASLDVRNVEFIERDMENLKFSDGLFDVAVCAFGIFFVEDMENQLSTKDQEQFKREHLDEVETLRTRDGIWLDVGVLFTSGKRGWIRK